MNTRITEADRRTFPGIDLGADCPMCPAHEAREHQLRHEMLLGELNAERLTVADQRETIDRQVAEVYRQKTHFWMLAIVPIFMAAYALYRVRP